MTKEQKEQLRQHLRGIEQVLNEVGDGDYEVHVSRVVHSMVGGGDRSIYRLRITRTAQEEIA